MERYMAFSICQVQFLDSFQFTMKSLDNLVETMNEDDFKYTRRLFPDVEKFDLMTRKGVFPYDFFDNILKLQCIAFSSTEAFFNTLANQECSTNDFLHGKLVWNTFNCQSFTNYHDIYLKSDLLADFFEKFRSICMHFRCCTLLYSSRCGLGRWFKANKCKIGSIR